MKNIFKNRKLKTLKKNSYLDKWRLTEVRLGVCTKLSGRLTCGEYKCHKGLMRARGHPHIMKLPDTQGRSLQIRIVILCAKHYKMLWKNSCHCSVTKCRTLGNLFGSDSWNPYCVQHWHSASACITYHEMPPVFQQNQRLSTAEMRAYEFPVMYSPDYPGPSISLQ